MVLMSVWRAWREWGSRVWSFSRPLRATGSAILAPVVGERVAVDELHVPPERPWGCGWFDSSLDLREGLAVIEHEGVDVGLALELMFEAAPRLSRVPRQESQWER